MKINVTIISAFALTSFSGKLGRSNVKKDNKLAEWRAHGHASDEECAGIHSKLCAGL
jgi:hypothetical protein